MSFEFMIPLARDDLTRRSAVNQYVVDEVYSVRVLPARIQECRSIYRSKGPLAILSTFDCFYSLLRHFYSTEPEQKKDSWDLLMKAVPAHSSLLVEVLEKSEVAQGGNSDLRIKHLNAVKMSVYLVCQFIEMYEGEVTKPAATAPTGKGKKKAAMRAAELGSLDWDYERERAVRALLQLFQLPVHRLWSPPVMEEEFVNLVANSCYKLLENATVSKNKATRDLIFQLIATLVKKFNHGLSCSLKMVQLLQHFEHLAAPLASALEIFAKDFGVTSVVSDIMREIGRMDVKDLARDTSGTRAYCAFLVELAERVPAVMMPTISVLLSLLDGESYTMRNSVLGVLGEMVIRVLSREGLDDKEKNTRDQFLDKLEDHLHDVNAFVRSKVLQIWLSIVNEKAVPLPRQQALCQLVIGRLHDKSCSVRKYAIQVLTAMLSNNPFAAKLPPDELRANYEKEEQKLQELQPEKPVEDTPEDKARKDTEASWAKMEPAVRKAVLGYLKKSSSGSEDEDEEENSEDEEGDKASEEGSEDTIKDDDTPESIKDGVLARLRSSKFPRAVKLYSSAVEAFPGNPYFKAGESVDGEEEDEEEEEGNGRVDKLVQGLKVVFFCENLSDNILAAVTGRPAPLSPEEQRRQAEVAKQQALVQYLKDSVDFIESVQRAMPTICQLLGSKSVTDVLEAVHFLVTGFEFGVSSTMLGIRRMLALVWSKEANVKEAVVNAYRRLYLHPDVPSSRAKAVGVAASLTALTVGATYGDLTSLEELMAEFVRSKDLDQQVVQVLWERFALKIPGITAGESRAALQLLAMASSAEIGIVRSNVDVLVREGLGPRGQTDFLLTRDVCVALNKLAGSKKMKAGTYDEPHRYPQTHEIFQRLQNILVNGVTRLADRHWLPMAEQAVTCIYKMAEHPDILCGEIIKKIAAVVMAGGEISVEAEETPQTTDTAKEPATEEGDKEMEATEQQSEEVPVSQATSSSSQSSSQAPRVTVAGGVLTRFLSLCGHVALRQLVLLDCDMFNELKRRHALRETDAVEGKQDKQRHNKRRSILTKAEEDEAAVEEELGLGGAVAEDAEAEYIRRITETQILSPQGLLGLLCPLLVSVCSNQVKYSDPELRAAASLALAKFMMVSSEFCEDHIALLFTLLEKSPHSAIRANLIVALGDLNFRFPNSLEPWTPNLYARLRDESPKVRKNTLMVLTHLILNDMVKVKGQISELATCIVDSDERIAGLSKLFFFELARKGNAIYNILPDVVSRLSDTEVGVNEESFRVIIKYLFSFIQKERQCESLVEKLCHRFRATTCERQWRDMAYCLSMLTYSEKSIRKLQENFTCFHDKLHEHEVFVCFSTIVNGAKKFAKPEAKALVDELEERLNVCHSKGVEDEEAVSKATKASRALREKGNRRTPKKSPGGSGTRSPRGRTPRGKSGRKAAAQLILSDDNDDDEDFLHPARRDAGGGGEAGTRASRRGGGGGATVGVKGAAAGKKKPKHKPSFSSDEEESEEEDLLSARGGDAADSDSNDDSENINPNISGDSSSTAEPVVKKSRQKRVDSGQVKASERSRRAGRSGAVK